MQAPNPALRPGRSSSIKAVLSCAGLLGACGIVLGAAGAHAGGGDLARLGAVFLLVHAAALVALAAYAGRVTRPLPLLASSLLLGVGAACFSGDLACVAFTGEHVLHGMAPAGGVLLIFGWIGTAISPWICGE